MLNWDVFSPGLIVFLTVFVLPVWGLSCLDFIKNKGLVIV